jgi:hypothetical protein
MYMYRSLIVVRQAITNMFDILTLRYIIFKKVKCRNVTTLKLAEHYFSTILRAI